ncbi:MAG: hypothetical protein WD266_02600 [Balneolales bacterium]
MNKAAFTLADFKIPPSYISPLLISAILLGAYLSFGLLDSYANFLTALGAAFITELVLSKLVTGKWRNLTSAYISGISVGILIRSTLYWPYALCAALSIASKYVLTYRGRHLWNPSNFGIVAMLILASDSMAILSIQWGNNMWAIFIIWIIGFVALAKVDRFHICFTYVSFFLLFGFIRSWLSGDPYLAEIAPITGPMYQLFVLFMITDPKTTVKTRKGQYTVAFLIAFVEMIFRLNEAVYAPFYALFIVGPLALVFEIWWEDRKQTRLTSAKASV